MNCPKCGGEMYDNRSTKTNPSQPDYKCKSYKTTGCDGVIWPPRNKAPETSYAPVDQTERSRRIERQHSQEMALRYWAIYAQNNSEFVIDPVCVKELTDWFQSDLDQP